jgi:photosystem II stability/assembly factor-like uncharacterized protein
MADEQFYQRGDGRLFIQKFGPRPDQAVQYRGCASMGGFTEPRGDKTPVWCPDPNVRRKYIKVDQIKGAPENPTASIMMRLASLNFLRKLTCAFDAYVPYGRCKNPQDLVRGWSKILHFNGADITNIGSENLLSLEPGDEGMMLLTHDITAEAIYEIDPLSFALAGGVDITTEIAKVLVCDAVSCGECEDVSEGGEKIYLIARAPGAGSPAILPELVYTEDGGASWLNQYIDTLAAAQQPDDGACVGDYIVVVSDDIASLHYADKDDLDTWTEVATGFVAGGEPVAIYAPDPSHVYIVGLGGYVYLSTDITAGVSVLDAGVATAQNLNAVHGIGSQFIVAVGQANAVIYSDDGGATFQSVTGPAAGVHLLTVWCVNEDMWWVGTDNSGRLYYTKDRGQTWTEKTHPDSTTGGDITDIRFTEDPAVGYFAFNTMTPAGRLYRTIDGGSSWYRLPEATGVSIPANDRLNSIAIVGVNELWAVGLGDNAADGVAIHGVGYE